MQTRRMLIAIAIAAGLLTGAARAGPPEDFAAGDAAYRQGDVRVAMEKLRKAADAGHAKAQVLLGSILDASEQDEEAARFYTMAADQGDPEGMYLLSNGYFVGEGVARNPARGRHLLEKAARLGHRGAIHAMAAAFLGAGPGFSEEERDSPAALDWIRKAADAGHLPSIDRLVVAYRKGELGLASDAKLAREMEERGRTLRGVTAKTPPARRRPPLRVPGNG